MRVTFPNADGIELSARLELPVNQHPHSYAIFAHCFTCSSSLAAVRNISRALHQEGVAVLRFDFTGLGESEGDFSTTNFTSNIADLLSAAEFLAAEYEAPNLLVGHSLGGAAVLCAAQQLESVRAVATIGAPYDPGHVTKMLRGEVAEIEQRGEAEVNIGGRPFRIRKQFLDDLGRYDIEKNIAKLGKALLILHSPQDLVVEIENAAHIYHAARHPKSFISLDGADHLLSAKADSRYTGEVLASWAKRYLSIPAREKLQRQKDIAVRLGDEGFTTEVMVRHHSLTADEPESVGGNDFGPSPYELLSASLGTCTAMTLQMYARRKKWDLREVIVHLDHRKDHTADMLQAHGEKPQQIDHFDRLIEMIGDLDEAQRARLLEIAERCPVHRTLHGAVEVTTRETAAPSD
jgi:putative redox protein